jgi:hypothetical protein
MRPGTIVIQWCKLLNALCCGDDAVVSKRENLGHRVNARSQSLVHVPKQVTETFFSISPVANYLSSGRSC